MREDRAIPTTCASGAALHSFEGDHPFRVRSRGMQRADARVIPLQAREAAHMHLCAKFREEDIQLPCEAPIVGEVARTHVHEKAAEVRLDGLTLQSSERGPELNQWHAQLAREDKALLGAGGHRGVGGSA
ncbi:predicted protein [Histoplasma capsulatum H143]|uniref:Uncharacterized protein n=1 Tax=Ajellomyces capsulatus (strain H143) TaxID=544712 RepID=C6HPL8_AJECH|nr:predicted protein [Histoplasma capsulatum H143]